MKKEDRWALQMAEDMEKKFSDTLTRGVAKEVNDHVKRLVEEKRVLRELIENHCVHAGACPQCGCSGVESPP